MQHTENSLLHSQHIPQKRKKTLLITMVLISIIGLHCLNITADVPDTFLPKELGLRVDEGYKTLGPRNVILFGSMRWSAGDEYATWFGGSPITQIVMLGSFWIFGADLLVARLTALGYFAILLLIVIWFEHRRMPTRFVVLSIFLLGVEPILFYFSRAALFEICMAVFLTGAILSFTSKRIASGHRPLVIIFIAMLLAFFLVKHSALLYFLPATCAVALSEILPNFHHRRSLKWLTAVGSLSAILAAAIFPAYGHRISLPDVMALLERLASNSLAVNTPFFTAAAWIAGADFIRERGVEVLRDNYLTALIATVIGPPILLTLMTYAPARYSVAIIPAHILLIVYWLHSTRGIETHSHAGPLILWVVVWPIATLGFFYLLWAGANIMTAFAPILQGTDPGISTPTALKYLLIPCAAAAAGWLLAENRVLPLRGAKIYLAACTLLVAVIHSAVVLLPVLIRPSYAVQQISSSLENTLPEEASLIGDWAPLFTLGTNFPSIYASDQQNDGESILRICPSHYLDSGTRFDRSIIESYRAVGVKMTAPRILGTYYGQKVTIFELDYSGTEKACTREQVQ